LGDDGPKGSATRTGHGLPVTNQTRVRRVRACGTPLEARWGRRQAISYDRAVTLYIAGGLGGLLCMFLFMATSSLRLHRVAVAVLVVAFLVCLPMMAVAVILTVRVTRVICSRYDISARAQPKLTLKDMKNAERFDAWLARHQRRPTLG